MMRWRRPATRCCTATHRRSCACIWRYSDAEADELHTRFRNSADAPARKAAYQRIQDKLAEAAGTTNPLVMLGRTIVTSPSITGVTFSQDPYARHVHLRPKA